MSLHLFDIRCEEFQRVSEPLRIANPLGSIEFCFAVGRSNMTQSNATSCRLPNGNFAVSWEFPTCRAEGVCGRISPRIPAQFAVEDCWARLWRVDARISIQELTGTAKWLPGYSWEESGPESGQLLDAIAFENHSWKLLIGTEGDEALAIRAGHSDWMPKRHLEMLNGSFVPGQYQKDGLTVRSPGLRPGERSQVQFVVAWERQAPECCAAWYAVEQSPDLILKELLKEHV